LITLVGSQVSQWNDCVAGLPITQATSSRRPTYSATTFNGFASLTFDGVDDYLENTLPNLPSGTTPSRIFAVVQSDAPSSDTGTKMPYGRGGVNNQWRRLHRFATNSVSLARAAIGNGSNEISAVDPTDSFDGRHFMDFRVTATGGFLQTDNNSIYTSSVVPSTATGALRIGANDISGGNNWNGQIRHILETTDTLTTQEASDLRAWLAIERHP
jgi:hypothetical protein